MVNGIGALRTVGYDIGTLVVVVVVIVVSQGIASVFVVVVSVFIIWHIVDRGVRHTVDGARQPSDTTACCKYHSTII
jgi:hypothetical protein